MELDARLGVSAGDDGCTRSCWCSFSDEFSRDMTGGSGVNEDAALPRLGRDEPAAVPPPAEAVSDGDGRDRRDDGGVAEDAIANGVEGDSLGEEDDATLPK